MDDVSGDVLHRPMREPDDIRLELTMEVALKFSEMKGPDVVEMYSQPRMTQECGIQKRFNIKPGWSVDLTLDDPLTGQP